MALKSRPLNACGPAAWGVRRIMIEIIAMLIVIVAALFLIGLSAFTFFAPAFIARFLNGFASSSRVHYLEMLARLTAGSALIIYSPRMLFSNIYWLFGWAIVISTAILIVLPWQWHNRFAQKALPPLTSKVWLFGIFSLPLGAVILFSVLYEKIA